LHPYLRIFPRGAPRPPILPRRLLPSLALLVILSIALAACSGAADAPTTSAGVSVDASPAPASAAASPVMFPLTLIDDEGTAIQIPEEPQRIISLTPAVTETLFAIGAGPRVVATTDFDDYPPEAVDLPDVASYTSVDIEKIVGLAPDLVIAGGNGFNDPEALGRLRSLGIPIVVIYAPDVATVLSDIDLVGEAVGRSEAAAALTASMRTRIDAVTTATASLSRPRTFYELDATKDIYGPADDSFLQEMLKLAGAEPITTGSPTVFSIPLETLVAADPEIILLGDAAYGVTPEQVAARPGWSSMTAVTSGAIRPVPDVIITRPGPRLPDGLEALAVAVHPELAATFPDAAPSPTPSPPTPSPTATATP
jgi:iron complex transport system substrate-binding protein